MKYWLYFAVKTALAVFVLLIVRAAIRVSFPIHNSPYARQDPFAHDLGYTTLMMLFFLFSSAVIYLVIWDQRYRCRTCLRRLRMPVAAGSWPNMFLKGQPRMEYICLYGHGTLKVPDVDLTGSKSPDWESNDDMWKELESIEAGQEVKLDSQFWRMGAGIGVLVLMAAIGVLLIPPYVENWKLQSFLNQMAQDPATAQKAPEIVRANIVDKAASLGLPVHTDDVRVVKSADGMKIEVLYIVRIDLPIYTVDLHFRPAA